MPNRKKKHGKGEIIGWEVVVNEKEPMYFTVRVTWENQITRQFHYQFETETEFWKRFDMLKRQNVGKEILQEVFDEVIHSYAGGRMLHNERLERQGRKAKSEIQVLENDDFIERWLSVPSMRELRDDSTPRDEV